ncbi:MAG: cobyrinate a,c-diamide synthase, partial [Gammaproteobacteria bacterium]|nr:cobyrinate a,c-diamide synthase [Gammaproteobacteria bacterium]
ECGGMLYLLEQLVDKEENCANMLGIIPGTARMQKKLVSLGLQSLSIEDQEIRGHTFHHSKLDSDWQADYFCQRQKSDRPGEAVYLQQGLFASYLHLYFPSNPTLVAKIFLGEC